MRRWDDSAKMRKCGVSKTPGCSWIDVGARAHEFHAEVEKLKTRWPPSAIEQCIRRDCIFWLMTTAKMLNDKLCS
ncbi:hypothetical protein NC653_004650 [Populus alba x Populus x berolinensis]|uniref:Uncharacterized protein n=1 Tax=Populus alba x Populus x berolinensis TaxID=444605 RepID=A0AAD6WKB2_9ROSI|nr:hypothetical protein NC653_004650 [Populus alba x Populus x berolinensis]